MGNIENQILHKTFNNKNFFLLPLTVTIVNICHEIIFLVLTMATFTITGRYAKQFSNSNEDKNINVRFCNTCIISFSKAESCRQIKSNIHLVKTGYISEREVSEEAFKEKFEHIYENECHNREVKNKVTQREKHITIRFLEIDKTKFFSKELSLKK